MRNHILDCFLENLGLIKGFRLVLAHAKELLKHLIHAFRLQEVARALLFSSAVVNVFLLHSRPFVFLRNHQNFSEFVSTALCCSAYPLLLLWLVPLAPCPLSIQNPCHLANYWSKWSFCAGHSSSSTPTLENQSFFMYLALCTKACSCWNRLGIGSLVSLKRNRNSTDILDYSELPLKQQFGDGSHMADIRWPGVYILHFLHAQHMCTLAAATRGALFTCLLVYLIYIWMI